jgi:hypothetical protein
VTVHTEIHLWPKGISNSKRYAICPPPVAAPSPTYTCKSLTGAKFLPVVDIRASRQQRTVPVKVSVGCRLAHGTFRRGLGEDYRSGCVRVRPHLFVCKAVRLTSKRSGHEMWGKGFPRCMCRWTQHALPSLLASVRYCCNVPLYCRGHLQRFYRVYRETDRQICGEASS